MWLVQSIKAEIMTAARIQVSDTSYYFWLVFEKLSLPHRHSVQCAELRFKAESVTVDILGFSD